VKGFGLACFILTTQISARNPKEGFAPSYETAGAAKTKTNFVGSIVRLINKSPYLVTRLSTKN
jgi:hypothetical protein